MQSLLRYRIISIIINYEHDINFDKPRIKYRERNRQGRKFLESYDIEKFKKSKIPLMNDQQNALCLIPNIFMSML